MCEFCVKHGDGKRWYLNAANYVSDLLADARRQEYISDFIPEITANAARWLRLMDRGLRVSPAATRRVAAVQARRMKKIHYGQVIPIEDVRAVLGAMGQVVRLPCVCREVLLKKEEAVCFLLSASPEALGLQEFIGRSAEAGPYVAGMERVSAERALEEMTRLEEEGKIHTVWTFITPFIGAICNCDHSGCLAMNFTRRGLPLYLPGEDVAEVSAGNCAGCGECVSTCLFGALSVADGTARVNGDLCHGCGICRRSCPPGALSLRPRPSP